MALACSSAAGRMLRYAAALLALSWCGVACAAARHDWNAVRYVFRPLVQKGSPNLLPPLQYGRKLWTFSNAAAAGSDGIRLGAETEGKPAGFRITVKAKPHTLYRLRWRARFSADAKPDFKRPYPGLHGWFCPAGKKGTLPGAIRMREWRAGAGWRERAFELFTPADATHIRIWLDAYLTAGYAVVRDIRLEEEVVRPEEMRQVLEAESGAWGEAARPLDPAPPAAATLFHRKDPDALSPFSRPRSGETPAALDLAGAPGETLVTTLALYTPRKLTHVRLDTRTAPGRVEWKVVRFHPRRIDGYGRGRTWRWTADVLLDAPDGAAAPAGRTTVFWLRVQIPKNARPGERTGEVVVRADGFQAAAKMRLRVRPFRLVKDVDKSFVLWGDIGRWKKMSDDAVLAELADMRRHGVNALMVPCKGRIDVKDGRVTGWRMDDFSARSMQLSVKAGFRRLALSPLSWWLTRALPGRLGLRDAVRCRSADQWPPAMAEAAAEVLRRIQADARRRGWPPLAYVAIDEPGYWKKGSLQRLDWDRRVCRAAGWKLFCTSSYPPDDPFGRGIDYHCYGLSKFYPGYAKKIIAASRAAGQQVWGYGVGSYSGQKGRLVRNRYLWGFVFYKLGLDGIAAWTFQRPRGNAYDDFGKGIRYSQPCITYPDPRRPGRNLDTPQWEALRQGWLDYCYCATLARRLARRPDEKTAAAFRRLLDSMPWGGNVFDDPALTNAQLDAWRGRVAELIEQTNP